MNEKSRSTAGYLPEWLNLTVAQPDLVELLEVKFGQKNILPQFARRRDFGMNLPKLRYHRRPFTRPGPSVPG